MKGIDKVITPQILIHKVIKPKNSQFATSLKKKKFLIQKLEQMKLQALLHTFISIIQPSRRRNHH